MIIACLGDSLTEGDYGVFGKRGIAAVHNENYPYFLAELTNAQTLNYGKCGYTATSYLAHYTEGNVPLDSNIDLVLIMLGTNGGMSAQKETQGNQDYETLIELCQKDAPNATVILCTPPHATENPVLANCGFAKITQDAGQFIKRVAEEKKLRCIDTQQIPEFTAENEAIMQPNDGLHFGKIGYRVLASFIAEQIRDLL